MTGATLVRLLCAYDGTDFSGFQAQPGRRTVQGVLASALQDFAPGPVVVRGAGRTDAGVHALGQVVTFQPPGHMGADDMRGALAGRLPADVTIRDAADGPAGFDPRSDAVSRTYVYLVWNHDVPHPLLRRYMWWIGEPIDDSRLRDALALTEGTHDFSSFARVRQGQSPVRTVHHARVDVDGQLIRIELRAESFLHQMVRSLVGSAVQAGLARRSVSWMAEALLARNRAAAGPVAPAHGLTLVDVAYPHAEWPNAAPTSWPWQSVSARAVDRVPAHC